MPPIVVRAPVPTEWGPACVHVGDAYASSPEHASMLALLHDALDAPGPEGEVLVALEGATLRGVMVFATDDPAPGGPRILLMAADEPGVAERLRASAARPIVARDRGRATSLPRSAPPLPELP